MTGPSAPLAGSGQARADSGEASAVAKVGLGQATTLNFSDTGNAELFVAMFRDLVRFDHKRGRWLIWDATVGVLTTTATRTEWR